MPDYSLSTWIGVVLGAILALADALYPPKYEGVRIGRVWGFWKRW